MEARSKGIIGLGGEEGIMSSNIDYRVGGDPAA